MRNATNPVIQDDKETYRINAYPREGWEQSFTFSYAIDAPPQPALKPDQKLSVEVHADTDANFLVWDTFCALMPQNAAYMKVTMGDVADFYKPTEDDAPNWCHMLMNNNKHLWYL